MVLSDFLNGYTSISIYSLYSLRLHYAAQKDLVLHKKLFHVEVNVGQQKYVSHKKICCGNKKNYVTPKRRLMLSKYV